jgi:hypothetical protein
MSKADPQTQRRLPGVISEGSRPWPRLNVRSPTQQDPKAVQSTSVIGTMGRDDHAGVLRQWAEWGRAYLSVRDPPPNWAAVLALIEAAAPRLQEDSCALRDLLERSKNQLGLPDPLLCDLGVHRWLDEETSYSNWLAWALERLRDPSLILDVLGIQSAEFGSACAGEDTYVEREAPVQEGLPGRDGLIDLLISFGEPPRALVGVEVKTSDEQYWKQQGYLDSLRRLCEPVECVLVANYEVPERQRCGFKLRTWKEVSIALRKAIGRYSQDCEHPATLAMMLAFVAAIEQKLLDLPVAAVRRAWRNQPTLASRDVVSYLEETLETVQ